MKGFKKVAIPLLAAALIIAAVLPVIIFSKGDKIARGVMLSGQSMAGYTVNEAEKMIEKEDLSYKEIVLYSKGGKSVAITGGDINLQVDVLKTCENAYLKGRSDNFLNNLKELAISFFIGADTGYAYTYDEEKLREIIYGLGVQTNGEKKEYVLEYTDSSVIVSRGTSGQSEDISGALYTFLEGISKKQFKIYLPLNGELPKKPDLNTLYDEIYIEPQDASYEITTSGVVMTPDVVGRRIDMEAAGSHIEEIARGDRVELELIWIAPKVTLSELEAKLFNHTLAQYTTSYSSANKNRSTNMAIAAGKINGVVLAPGEVFSYNNTVGPRTRSAGFMDAPVFQNGESVDGVGGGICQVSSTLYSAVLYADLEITSRRNHSMTVGYIPKGQDATVSYGTIDFKFKNSTAYPIKISAYCSGGRVSVSILGTAPDKEKTVKIVNNVISAVNPVFEEIQNEDLVRGERKITDKGKTGYTVDTTRIVFENGYQVKSEKMGRSVYRMVPGKVLVGVKMPEVTQEPEPAPESAPEEIPVLE